jgi:hypothetical protein
MRKDNAKFCKKLQQNIRCNQLCIVMKFVIKEKSKMWLQLSVIYYIEDLKLCDDGVSNPITVFLDIIHRPVFI